METDETPECVEEGQEWFLPRSEIWWQIVVHYNNGVRRPSSVILKYHQAFYQVPIHSSLSYHLLLYLLCSILNQDVRTDQIIF